MLFPSPCALPLCPAPCSLPLVPCPFPPLPYNPPMPAAFSHGHASPRGNLLGLQPCVTARDYASADALFASLNGDLQAAADRGWLNDRTVAVLPEYLGTWLAAA